MAIKTLPEVLEVAVGIIDKATIPGRTTKRPVTWRYGLSSIYVEYRIAEKIWANISVDWHGGSQVPGPPFVEISWPNMNLVVSEARACHEFQRSVLELAELLQTQLLKESTSP